MSIAAFTLNSSLLRPDDEAVHGRSVSAPAIPASSASYTPCFSNSLTIVFCCVCGLNQTRILNCVYSRISVHLFLPFSPLSSFLSTLPILLPPPLSLFPSFLPLSFSLLPPLPLSAPSFSSPPSSPVPLLVPVLCASPSLPIHVRSLVSYRCPLSQKIGRQGVVLHKRVKPCAQV